MLNLLNLFKKFPLTGIILFYGLIPSLFLFLTIIFIMLHIEAICPTTILDIIFNDDDDNKSDFYRTAYNFIDTGTNFIGYFVDVMFKLIDVTLDAIMNDENSNPTTDKDDFFDSFSPNKAKCDTVKLNAQPISEQINNLQKIIN